ncbi:hypothetical protein RvY_11442 [Ramazzottius varieornatus]|uniref:Uncharacterized protein n=1 Tax=Ramazzottius varieornatus TaxID=947166 RepID=A0A1D1VG35_RAMVA|nr:hypothetical protein RvY_11442 [Ramazzottius varieornatus]
MAKGGSAVIFWHNEWIKCHHDPPMANSFVQAVAHERIFPLPGGTVDERAVCQVEVEEKMHDCLVLTIDHGRSLAEQYDIVAKDKKHLEARGARWMADLKLDQNGTTSACRPQRKSGIPEIPPAQVSSAMVQPEASAPKRASVDPSPSRNALNPSNFQNVLAQPTPVFVTVKSLPKKPVVKLPQPRVSKKLAGANFAPVRDLKVPPPRDRLRRAASVASYRMLEGFDSDDEEESSASQVKNDRASMPPSRHRVRAPTVARATSVEPSKKPQKRVSFGSVVKERLVSLPVVWSGEPANRAVINAKGVETDTQTLTQYIVTNAKTVKKAVQLAVEELFTKDEVKNGVFTQRALNKLPSAEQDTATILDEQKMAAVLEAACNWKRRKSGNRAFLSELSLWNYMREIKKELRLQALAAAGERQESASKKMKV